MSERYATIAADPPWSYGRDDRRFPSFPGSAGNQTRTETTMGYETMSAEDICRIPVGRVAARDCRLFLWATSKHLPAAMSVLACWGFEYRQTLVWHKTGRPTPFGGSVAPNHAEFLLVAAKGSPPVSERHRTSVVPAMTQRKHSAKPDAFYDLIERVSPGPYLEMFARRGRLGWDSWGDEAPGGTALLALPGGTDVSS